MKIVKTQQFEDDRLYIEDHIYNSNDYVIKFVDKFIDELDAAVQWVHSVHLQLVAPNSKHFAHS